MIFRKGKFLFRVTVFLGMIEYGIHSSEARPFRPDLIPNGNVFSCNTCHIIAGGPRNAFGLAVQQLVAPGAMTPFWGPDLAALDSDGDGFTNGEELLNALLNEHLYVQVHTQANPPGEIRGQIRFHEFVEDTTSGVNGWDIYQ